ncbi:hypothetical protein [Lachnoclostridium sp. Marseille-P6806]|uniref:hypothetical protein n=1 Tax=Lachnoclostridium sp. Marseille-P6806 TaxID=2364793 RepID=UPI001030487A|nr:hypothetical protein [Lachnoclostridium sp. Marseille-P6806]
MGKQKDEFYDDELFWDEEPAEPLRSSARTGRRRRGRQEGRSRFGGRTAGGAGWRRFFIPAAALILLVILGFLARSLRVQSGAAGGGDSAGTGMGDVLFFHGDGSLTARTRESFAEDYYSEAELREMIQRSTGEYNGAASGTGEEAVRAGELTVEDGEAELVMEYASAADYAAFNDVELYCGTVREASAAGYDLTPLLSSPSLRDGKKLLTSEELDALSEHTIIILTQSTVLHTPSAMLYCTGNLVPDGKKSAATTDTVSASNPAMLILK